MSLRSFATAIAFAWVALEVAAAVTSHAVPAPFQWTGRLGLCLRLGLYVADVIDCLRTERLRNAVFTAIPPAMKRLLGAELAIYRSFGQSFIHRSVNPAGYGFGRAPRYRALLAVVSLSAIVEAPFVFFVVRHSVPGGRTLPFDLACAAGAIYCLVLMRADWFALGRTAHDLGDNQLQLRLGFRFQGSVPLDAIATVEEVDRKPLSNRTLRITPVDRPNVLLTLNREIIVGNHWLRGPVSAQSIAVYVDEPAAFVRRLATPPSAQTPGRPAPSA